jgi:K+-transporting ATPase KdpF subunit
MTAESVIAAILSVAVLIYLVYTLIRPERF